MKFHFNSLLKQLLLTLSILFFSASIYAQTHTAKTVTISQNCYGFYEYLPQNYSTPDRKFPLIIYSGGAGTFGNGSSSQLSKLLAEGIPYYIKNSRFPNSVTVNGVSSSFIVISPQFVKWPAPSDIESVLNYVLDKGYKVDLSRIYLTGFSAGGDAAWKYPNSGVARARRFAAVVPVAGYNYPYVDTGAKYIAAAELPVWALHSNDDGPAPVYWSQNFVNKINSYNPPIRAKITRISGVTHDNTKLHVYNPTFRDGGYNIYEWMLLYRRGYPPVANAGSDLVITMPQNSVTPNGVASSDPENGPLQFSWSKISGPSLYKISDIASPNPVVSSLVAGTYDFQLRVTDNRGLYSTDNVKITVINPNPNELPKANAGTNLRIALPVSTANLSGSASSDQDGCIETYAWKQVSGPAAATLVNSTSVNPVISNLKKGTYVFQLTVTDNQGGKDSSVVEVQVYNPYPNVSPESNAGDDQTITLPTNTVSLSGSRSSDPDGVIAGYSWTQQSGPSVANIASPTSTNTTASGLVEGKYEFALTVTDDSSAKSTDLVVVTVNPAPNYTDKNIKVNLFGGVNAYNQDGWNNWNVTGETNITSSNFKYGDGSTSLVSAVLSYSQGVTDNGATYGGTVCPPQVLRYATYSTAASRTLTIRGLDKNNKFDLEFYASRSTTGNSTTFVINGISKTILTDNNKTMKAVFTDVSPNSNGQIIVSINKVGTFSYLNGFLLTEKILLAQGAATTARTINQISESPISSSAVITISPNPLRNNAQLTIRGVYTGKIFGTLTDAKGNQLQQLSFYKNGETVTQAINVNDLTGGIYFLRIKIGDMVLTERILKSY